MTAARRLDYDVVGARSFLREENGAKSRTS